MIFIIRVVALHDVLHKAMPRTSLIVINPDMDLCDVTAVEHA
jgi:hypothetical protein